MEQLMTGVAMGLGLSLIGSPVAEAGFVGTARITGKVADSSGAAIPDVKVVAEIVASLRDDTDPLSIGPYPMGFWGLRRTVTTDGRGNYTVTLQIPDRIRRLYVRIVVAKMSGPPIYATQARLVALEPLPVPRGTKTYRVDFVLNPVPSGYGAFVSGTITDAESGEPLRGAGVVFNSIGTTKRLSLITDAKGFYFGVVPLNTQIETLSYRLGVRVNRTGVPNGVVYNVPTWRTITFKSGDTSQLDAALSRSTMQTAVVGRVIDGTSGQPIPKALVQLEGLHISGGTFESTFVTDLFGYYQIRVSLNVNEIAEMRLKTRGAYVVYSDSLQPSPYSGQRIDLLGKIRAGEIYLQDFLLSPCTSTPQVCTE